MTPTTEERSSDVAEALDEETAEAVAGADYDAEADLALPPSTAGDSPDSGFVPFAGELAPEPPGAGYDVERDTGIAP